MFIETQDTPNPHTMKFIPNMGEQKLLESGIKSYSEDDDLSSSPLAKILLEIEGVKGVFLTPDFITITKSVETEWGYLRTIVLSTMVDHFAAGLPIYIKPESKESKNSGEEDEIIEQIKELIETRVRPSVAQDGGDIIFKDFADGVVFVELHGSCSGCPSATITLKSGIENMLKHYIPEVTEVRAIND